MVSHVSPIKSLKLSQILSRTLINEQADGSRTEAVD